MNRSIHPRMPYSLLSRVIDCNQTSVAYSESIRFYKSNDAVMTGHHRMLTTVVETRFGPVEYSELGTGTPVLYFHGTGVTSDVMLSVESPLAESGFRLIAPNRPGYGRTPLSPHHSAVDCSRVIAALLDSVGVGSVSVMGSSGGAAFAACFAANYPLRTTSLTLLCPQLHRWDHKRWLPITSRWTLPLLRQKLLLKLLLKLYQVQLQYMTVARFLKLEAGARYPEVADDLTCQDFCKWTLAAMTHGIKCAGFENDFFVFTGEDIIGPDHSIHTPTLIIHDETDPIAPADHVTWFAARCSQCEVISLRAAGHLIWVGPNADFMHTTRVCFLNEHLE